MLAIVCCALGSGLPSMAINISPACRFAVCAAGKRSTCTRASLNRRRALSDKKGKLMRITVGPDIKMRRFASRAALDVALAERLARAAADGAGRCAAGEHDGAIGPAFALLAQRNVQ